MKSQQSKSAGTGLGVVAITVATTLLAWSCIHGEMESHLYIVPVDHLPLEAGAPDIGVFLFSAGTALVEVSPPSIDRLGLPASAALGAGGGIPLYYVSSELPDDLLAGGVEGGGVEVVYSEGGRSVFRAAHETAYRLSVLGYAVTRVSFIPLSKIAGRPDTRPLHETLKQARPLTGARLDFMRAVAESASADSLRDFIYWLCYDAGAGEYRSRFAARYDLNEDVTPVLYEKLRGYVEPAGGRALADTFDLLLGSQFLGQESEGVNVWGELPGSRTAAYYIVCGHFDATASRDPDFSTSWQESPAPGADDNATGTAAVVECARLLSPMSLDFGVKFVLFSAEEALGAGNLQGSKAFVDSLSEADSIIGVINLDMIGYMEEYRKSEISYGWRSEWLATEMEAMAGSLDLETGFEAFQRAQVFNSDHSSFWLAGIPALMLNERTQSGAPIPIYPYYHSASDTLGNLDMVQVRDNVALVAAYFSRFADIPGDSLPDLEVTPASLEFDWEGRSTGAPLVAGEDLELTVRALNIGGPMDSGESYTFRISRGQDGSGPVVHESVVQLGTVAGGTAVAGASWVTGRDVYGEVFFSVSLVPVDGGAESEVGNNATTVSLEVAPQQTALENFHVYPNPTGDPAGARLSGRILTSRTDFLANYAVRVYDVTGLRVLSGEGRLDSEELDIPLSGLSGDASALAPGLYVCTIDLNIRDEDANVRATAKFGVVSGQ